MKYLLILTALCAPLFAQTPAAVTPTFIKGDMSIRYATRMTSDGKPREGLADTYTLNVNVSNSAIFKGTIEQKPLIAGTVYGVNQAGSLTYNMDTDIVNPANPAQTRNVGKLTGTIPVDANNVYRFADGKVTINVFSMGVAKGFETKFGGLAAGKPPVKDGMMDKLTKQAINLTRSVNGKTVGISVTKYDVMEFIGHTLASGPVQAYPDVSVTGKMLYDYARSAWYFQNITVSYPIDGRQMVDVVSGNIRWVESANRKATGEGEYQFDVRVNEPPSTESAVFGGAQDEAAFFATDTSIAALTGVMKYKDTMVGDRVTASAVGIDLKGNKLTKQQAMYLCKLLFLSAIVPLNAE